MPERKLVTIQKIDNLILIEGADLIEIAQINGWNCVVKKHEFKVNDYCVYHEIDSFLPIHPRYEFLRKNCYKNVNGLGEGFRIKSIKLKGIISQGLVLPIDAFDIYKESETVWKYTNEVGNQYYIDPNADQDLSKIFGVIKYDPPLPVNLSGVARGNFPSHTPKTDSERIQNLKKYFEKEIFNQTFEVTEKLDGSSCTVYYYNEKVGVCSRNLDLDLEQQGNTFVDTAKQSGLFDVLNDLKLDVAIQGELIGPSIQKGRYNVPIGLYVFDIWDIDKQQYYTSKQRIEFVEKLKSIGVKIEHVPVFDNFTVDSKDISDIINLADGFSVLNKNTLREGLVFKRLDGKYNFKSISGKFLLKNEE